MEKEKVTMRTPFAEHHISKLPKGTKAQNDCPANEKITCKVCGGWHHPKVIHLDYVGHAALTDRLLDVDEKWSWRPLAFKDGLPAFDETGGLWIELTVNGVTRLGYGNASLKAFMDIGSREKEVIGDALRNAAMRFGAALDLWFKGDLHPEDYETSVKKELTEDEKLEMASGITLDKPLSTTATDLVLELATKMSKTDDSMNLKAWASTISMTYFKVDNSAAIKKLETDKLKEGIERITAKLEGMK